MTISPIAPLPLIAQPWHIMVDPRVWEPEVLAYIPAGAGDVAEWLRSGLQIRLPRFDSGRHLQPILAPRSVFFATVPGQVRRGDPAQGYWLLQVRERS